MDASSHRTAPSSPISVDRRILRLLHQASSAHVLLGEAVRRQKGALVAGTSLTAGQTWLEMVQKLVSDLFNGCSVEETAETPAPVDEQPSEQDLTALWDESPFDSGACRSIPPPTRSQGNELGEVPTDGGHRQEFLIPVGIHGGAGTAHAIYVYIVRQQASPNIPMYTFVVANAGYGLGYAQARKVWHKVRPVMVWRDLPVQFVTSVDLWAGLAEMDHVVGVFGKEREKVWGEEDFYTHLVRHLGVDRLVWERKKAPLREDLFARQQRAGRKHRSGGVVRCRHVWTGRCYLGCTRSQTMKTTGFVENWDQSV